ncbi:MAG: glycosyltransferase family 39 protein [bacterium]|nr:glycosyltransferase family 39 protein [bacterium]
MDVPPMRPSFLLSVIVLCAFVIRVWGIADHPVGLYWDEVAIGYNAWSILQTGQDEYGRFFPMLFESFNEFKLPGSIYSTVPSIAIFGPNAFGVRFPAVLYGTLTVLVLYWLTILLTGRKQIGLLSAFVLALMPWHVHFSRVGFEATGMVFWVLFGMTLILRAKRTPTMLLIALPTLAFSLYFYHAARIFIPLMLTFIIVRDWRWFWHERVFAIVGGFLALLLLLPLGIETMKPGRTVRFDQVSIFSDPTVLERSIKRKEEVGSILSRIANHRFVIWGAEAFRNELAHFSPQFLFISGDSNIRHSIPGFGMLFFVFLPFLLVGLILLFRFRNMRMMVFFWLIIAPIPGAFAQPAPHALRSILLIPVFAIVIAVGIDAIFRWIRGRTSVFIGMVVAIVFFSSFVVFVRSYLIDYPRVSAVEWADGYQELFAWLQTHGEGYERIAISGYHWKPYIFAAFYLPIEPASYLSVPTNHSRFGKFFFGPSSWDRGDPHYNPDFSWADVLKQSGTLTVLAPGEEEQFSAETVITEIKRANGSTAFMIRLVQ